MKKSRHRSKPPQKTTKPAVVPPARASRRTTALVLTIFAILFTTLELVSYTQKSATWDEPIHLTAGYLALAAGDYRVEPSHPPFMRMWAALPLLAMSPAVDVATIDHTPPEEWLGKAYPFAHAFMYKHNDADRMLYAARFMIVIWGVILGTLLFLWVNEWFGLVPAVLGLVLFAIEPNIAGHASLATTDLGVTCFTFGTFYFLWRVCRSASALNVAGLAVFFALATVTKFSGLALGPVVAVLLGIAVWRSAITVKTASGIIGLVAAVTLVAIWAVYGFRYAPSDSPNWVFHLQDDPVVQRQSPELAGILGRIDALHLLPNAFTQGVLVIGSSVQGHPAFLAGRVSTDGWWYYFPFAFLIKTPLVLIALAGGGLLLCIVRRRQLGLVNEACVVMPIAAFLGVAMASAFNVGVRHILPVYPFIVLIATTVASVLVTKGLRGRLALALVAVLGVAEVGSAYPRTLTFFNQLVGGPRNGFKYLSDSNLDWGQHLKLLKQWMDRSGVPHVNLAYFGTADPSYYGMNVTYLPGSPSFAAAAVAKPVLPGYVAISTTVLSGVYLAPPWRLLYSPFRDRQPAAVIGNSIRVYWVERWPEAHVSPSLAEANIPSDAMTHGTLAQLLLVINWSDQAALHYRRFLSFYPDDVGALDNLGIALMQTGEAEEAIRTFRQAVQLRPDYGIAQENLARALLERGEVDEAGAYAQKAVKLGPTEPAARLLLGRVLAAQGRASDAMAEFDTALELDPSHTEAGERLCHILQAFRGATFTGLLPEKYCFDRISRTDAVP